MSISLRIPLLSSLLVFSTLAAAQAQNRTPKQPIQVTWLGHSAFEVVSSQGTRLLIDPFLKWNPATPEAFKDLSQYKPSAILVTHSHADHLGDAVEISGLSGAPVIASYDLAQTLGLPNAIGTNVGGVVSIGDVTIHVVPAVHGSQPDGRPVGYVITFADGRSLYHTGDTWITWDMSFVQTMYHPEILLLCAGGGPYTQDPATAAYEVRTFFRPSVIVPMHYGTWDGLATEADVRDAFKNNGRLVVMTPGVPRTF
jgi:L-ascorbate metabolism protein UlaG (beta-lactamase superfamily)